MQREFNNRVTAQRELLRVINSHEWTHEKLHGLSTKAIERWVLANKIEPASRLVALVKGASEKLFFLANRSQEQISEDYGAIREDLRDVRDAITIELRR
jgi:hypothetical protein